MGEQDRFTLPEVFGPLNAEFQFTLDVASDESNALCSYFCTEDGMFFRIASGPAVKVSDKDGLTQPWFGRVFCNPPYNNITPWVEKASKFEAPVAVLLVPDWLDRGWFHDYVWDGTTHKPRTGVELRPHRGRLKFGSAHAGKVNQPVDGSMLVVFRRPE